MKVTVLCVCLVVLVHYVASTTFDDKLESLKRLLLEQRGGKPKPGGGGGKKPPKSSEHKSSGTGEESLETGELMDELWEFCHPEGEGEGSGGEHGEHPDVLYGDELCSLIDRVGEALENIGDIELPCEFEDPEDASSSEVSDCALWLLDGASDVLDIADVAPDEVKEMIFKQTLRTIHWILMVAE